MSWHEGRPIQGSLSAIAGNTDWTENMYRHPERQGVEAQNRYNIGHDVYSLGVCLLEIGLWDPLVQTRTANGQPQVSDCFRVAAKVVGAANPEAALRIALKSPEKVKETFLSLAEKELPRRMGLGSTRLVAACLKCLDSPSVFGANVDFTALTPMENGLVFRDIVLGFFSDMSL